MGLLSKAACRIKRLWDSSDPHSTASRLKICRVEELERRAMLAVDVPNINVGVFYYEADSGQDTAGDRIEITFNGGAPGTQLRQLTIDTDKDGLGLSVGDAFFDTQAGGLGASFAFPLTIVDQTGITQVDASVTDGGTKLSFNFAGFDVGEKLVISIDVDEKGFSANSSNAVVEGEEFEGSKLFATFAAPHFFDTKIDDTDPPRFFDEFTFAGLGLTLPPDGYIPPGTTAEQPVRTAGVSATLMPVPLPITISGTVFNDVNLNNLREAGDNGIAGVTVSLWEFNGTDYVATGKSAITDASGNYFLDGVLPGRYRLVENQPAGYFSVGATAGTVSGAVNGSVTSVDVISNITLLGGQDSLHNDFAESLPVSLSGHVYHDANQNGIRNAGEEPIGNVTLTLQRLASAHPQLGPTTTTVVTDASGFWSASGLQAGTYIVREVQPAGYYDGLDRAGTADGTAVNPGDEIHSIFLPSGRSGENYDFGELKPVKIGGQVHTDTDFDCILDPGETPLAGVTIYLLDAAGNRLASTTTDANGRYEFTNLAPGTYGIEELQPAGYYDGGDKIGSHGGTSLVNDKFAGITIGSGQSAADYNFCEHPPARLSGRVYIDDNQSGTIDSGETGIAGVTLQLLNAAGNPTGATATTLADGTYSFTNLAPGVYGIAELQPSGYYDGLDTAGTAGGSAQNPGDRITGATLAPAAHGQQYNFGELRPASISGRVHRDANGNCILDPGELPLEGVTIHLLDAAGNRLASTLTNAGGIYKFENLRPGTYGVQEVQPTGVFDGEEMLGSVGGIIAGNDLMTNISVGSGVSAINYDFCEHQPVSIAGRVYIDDNNNSTIDAAEVGIGGVTLQLLDAAGHATGATTVTAADGSYKFDGLAPGIYGVAEVQPSGYYDGLDSVGTAGGTALNPGDRITGAILNPGVYGTQYNFGELRPVGIRGRVHADVNGNCELDPGEAPLAGVTILLLDAAGNTIQTTLTVADGTYSFVNLQPGTYGVREVQPAGYFDGQEKVGTASGVISANDQVTGITLGSGQNGVNYDFCELPPASLRGKVYADSDGDCLFDAGERPLAGVTIYLLDPSGARIANTTTDANGDYVFSGLAPGVAYGVQEEQPLAMFDGQETIGSAGGAISGNDRITQISLTPGENAFGYDFCEHEPVSISGRVYIDANNNGQLDGGEAGIAGVTVEILDYEGNATGVTTSTDAQGFYSFNGLAPSVYGVAERQPAGYFDGEDTAGTAGGMADSPGDRIVGATLSVGVHGRNYNFGELLPAEISGYVFRDGPRIELAEDATLELQTIEQLRSGRRTPDDLPIAGVVLQLADSAGELLLDADGNPITAVTDKNGFYRFVGLPPGTYSIFQRQPSGYEDGIDTAGTTGGLAANPSNELSPFLLGIDHGNDAIVLVTVGPGAVSQENNFSEVQVTTPPPPPPPFIPPPENTPVPTPQPIVGFVVSRPTPVISGPPPITVLQTTFLAGGLGSVAPDFSWHLSIIDAGHPRGDRPPQGALVQVVESRINVFDGVSAQMTQSRWKLRVDGEAEARDMIFGMIDGIPITGDFNGDGTSEVGVFRHGQWYIDLNGNGIWDDEDLWAQLGSMSDLPVTGDWDGDGKTDIGIFGPSWPNDSRAAAVEPGLPDPENRPSGAHKNVPPKPVDAAAGYRKLKRTAHGRTRADLVDHVFYFGHERDIPLAGDWNGDGVDTIGVFHDGMWILDDNGDGQWLPGETMAQFGRPGDIPVVGDFNGDGIDELAVYRAGTWYIDMNNNRQHDAQDAVIHYGGPNDRPVVGDWDGDGREEIGLYQDGGNRRHAS